MSRIWRLLSFTAQLLCLIFAVSISLIQKQPYDASALSAVLSMSPMCEKPCWQQIRPGITTAEEAVALLEQNGWVNDLTVYDDSMEWSWSGQQPRLIKSSVPGRLYLRNGRAFEIDIPLDIELGDLYFLYGKPDWNSSGRGQNQAQLNLVYPAEYLSISIVINCPATRSAVWQSQPTVRLQSSPQRGTPLLPLLPTHSVTC
jgi:hypothetical protein